MTVTADYYEVLGVPRDADAETIKTAFRHLAHRYHPDVSAEPDAEQRFKEIAEAYGVLSDPDKRASYDAQGSAGVAGATAEDLWSSIDFGDIFGSGAPAFGGLFTRLFGPASAGSPAGEDVHLDLTISLEEVLTGTDQLVTIRRPGPCPQCSGRGSRPGTASRRCPRCGGAGQVAVTSRQGPLLVRQVTACPDCAGRGRVTEQPCPTCAATGRVLRNETVTFGIPAGIPEGATLRLVGQGMPSPVAGGPPGDAYVTIRTRTDARFSRVGADLWEDLHIQAPDAALGIVTAVPLPDGEAKVRVPPGTQPGSVLRVADKGLPHYGGGGRGSLHLKVTLDIPRQLSATQRQLYEQLRCADAGSTAEASPEPDVPRVEPGTAAEPIGRPATGGSLLTFASVLLLVLAAAMLLGGIAALSVSPVLLAAAPTGWVMIVVGALQLLAAAGVWAAANPGAALRIRNPRKRDGH